MLSKNDKRVDSLKTFSFQAHAQHLFERLASKVLLTSMVVVIFLIEN